MNSSFAFARNVANIKFEDIPAETANMAKMSVLDTLGVIMAGSTLASAGCRDTIGLIKEGAGKKESTLIGFGDKAPSWMAAFGNGAMGHALDYDDVHEHAAVHAGAVVVPAAFAVAERVGKVDGKRFLTAVVLGMDVACRLSMAAAPRVTGFHPTPVYGIFGAAAAAARVLGLAEDRVQHALGIAYSQAAGTRQTVVDAALTERLEVGFAAMGGVLSALLAEKGITGAVNSLEGEFGFFNVYNGGKCNRAALTSELGKRFEAGNLAFKPYPCGRSQHSSIDAMLQMAREHNIQPQDVESITVYKSLIAMKSIGAPIERKRRPENVIDAQFSIPYTVATALVRGRVDLRDFTPEAIKDPAVLDLAQKVDIQLFPEFEPSNFHPGITEIRTRGGKAYSRRIDKPSGNPDNPMPREQLIQKFMECASHAATPLSKEDLENVVATVMDLEKAGDAGDIVRRLA